MKRSLVVSILFSIVIHASSQIKKESAIPLPKVAAGTIQRIEKFPSKFVEARNVDVWLPDGYSVKKKYAVLYMHDGQMLFDSSYNWNHQEWGVDETVSKLIKEKKIRECIVVAVWNIPAKRYADYMPQKVIDSIPEPTKSKLITQQIKATPDADNYLKFLVTELKVYIDSAYATKKDVKNTFIMGSSMGGLISAYALCEYPEVFGGAGCLSTNSSFLPFAMINDKTDAEGASKFRNYLAAHLPKANTRKIYFDYGDQDMDAYYIPFQPKIDEVMRQKGYSEKYWITNFYPGEGHSEKSWNKRLHIPLVFLLKK